MDLYLNPATNDLQMSGGRLMLVNDPEQTGQRAHARMLTVRGEWFINSQYGLDYYGRVWKKQTPRPVLAAHIQNELLLAVGQGSKIIEFDMQYVGTTRTLSVQATVETAQGEEITVEI